MKKINVFGRSNTQAGVNLFCLIKKQAFLKANAFLNQQTPKIWRLNTKGASKYETKKRDSNKLQPA
ncbi:hypothetical protein [Helicobacter pylori]|uniref:hypothetical protein n=1 Tax=Helicobacter pylori TaxID=210 RepID=UPI001F0CABAD|nr:hypothetical protein [Helicobacter pylori]